MDIEGLDESVSGSESDSSSSESDETKQTDAAVEKQNKLAQICELDKNILIYINDFTRGHGFTYLYHLNCYLIYNLMLLNKLKEQLGDGTIRIAYTSRCSIPILLQTLILHHHTTSYKRFTSNQFLEEQLAYKILFLLIVVGKHFQFLLKKFGFILRLIFKSNKHNKIPITWEEIEDIGSYKFIDMKINFSSMSNIQTMDKFFPIVNSRSGADAENFNLRVNENGLFNIFIYLFVYLFYKKKKKKKNNNNNNK